ncbi:MAG: sulfite exporter TauE/SafE family protein [Cytophagales bacterium]|nr:MAG: sulfite exporter TauE/SafE family protein [Cytophagales bacterium]
MKVIKSIKVFFYYFLLFLSGLIGGFAAGLIGIGGGLIYILIIPEVLMLLGIPNFEIPQYTIANSLFTIFITSIIVNYNHFKNKIYYKELIIIGLSSIVSSVLALKYIVNTHLYSLNTFNIITLLIILVLLINSIYKLKQADSVQTENPNSFVLLIIGLSGGLISSFSGLGGGIIIIPLLVSLLKYDIKKASVISSGVIMITSFVATIQNMTEIPAYIANTPWRVGYIVLPIVFVLLIGVIISSNFGVNLAKRFSLKSISMIYIFLLVIILSKKLLDIYNHFA